MASGVWEALQMPFSTKIVMTANGHVEVSSAASDIGTGTYTIMAQVAAEMLGVPVDSVTVKLGAHARRLKRWRRARRFTPGGFLFIQQPRQMPLTIRSSAAFSRLIGSFGSPIRFFSEGA
jgi:CO/xanthine dehydrogenase Mo-binding subunit